MCLVINSRPSGSAPSTEPCWVREAHRSGGNESGQEVSAVTSQMPPTTRNRDAAPDDKSGATSETNEHEERTSIDEQDPASALRAICKGFLSKRLEMWVELYPDVLEEMGLATWEELRPYAHEEPQAIGGAFRALIATKAEGDQSRLMSEPSATQLGRLISELARSNTGTKSPPRAPSEAKSGLSGKTESELTRDTAKLAVYSSMKNEVKLEMANGDHKPAHVADVIEYAGETAKIFVGMEGYTELKGAVQGRKDSPGLSLEDMMASHSVPDDLRVQFARQLYAGLTPKYKREVLHRSSSAKQEQAAEGMYEDGIVLTHVLIAASLELSELEITTRRLQYLSVTAVPSNNKPGLMRLFERYRRNTVELYQLQDLGSIRKTAAKTMYDAGTILLTQYCDIAQTWSNLWQDKPQDESAGDIQVQQMKHLQAMVTRIEQMIRDLPDAKYARAQVHDRGPLMTGQGAQAGGTRDICRQFRRTGKCSYGDKCKFEHQAAPGIVLMVNPVQEHRIEQLQDTLMELPGIGDTRYYDDPETDVQFHQIYERAKQDVDEDDFEASMEHMKECMLVYSDD